MIFLSVVCAGLVFAADADAAKAAPIRIVAFGASETAGYGVGSSEAWPARLEAMLRAKGYDVSIANEGVSGDTTAGMLSRLVSAVPNGTRIALLAIYYYNDGLYGVSQGQSWDCADGTEQPFYPIGVSGRKPRQDRQGFARPLPQYTASDDETPTVSDGRSSLHSMARRRPDG